ncbi:MAG: TPM domain-containing protein [Methylophilaceae bacterium]
MKVHFIKLKTLFATLLLALQVLFSPMVLAELVAIPDLSARVTDLTQTLSTAEKLQIEEKLSAFEQKKGSQIAVLIVPTTKPEEIEQYSIRVVEKWKIGRKKVDDGILMLVAKDDHKMRIEVGYGLEGAIPDLTAKRVISEVIAPEFKKGNFANGLNEGVDRLIGLVDGEALPAPSATKHPLSTQDFGGLLPILMFGGLITGLVLRSWFGTFPGSFLNGSLIGGIVWLLGLSVLGAGILALIAFIVTMMLGGRGINGYQRGYSGGGGFGGGGFSSGGGDVFSGGGGGFGGGGASGSW